MEGKMADLKNRHKMAEDVITFWLDATGPHPNAKGVLHHYTKVDSMQSIIKSNSIWATHLLDMADTEELKYGRELFIKEWEAAESGSSFFDWILRGVIRALRKQEQDTDTYCFCLCGKEDLLSQWIDYTTPQCEGYSIGFNADRLNSNLVCITREGVIPFKPLPVVYSEELQRKLAKQLPDEMLVISETWNPRFTPGTEIGTEIAGFILTTVNILIATSFKRECLEEEYEVRCVNYSGTNPKSKYRTVQDREVRYVEVTMDDSRKLPIEEIIVGSGLDYEPAKKWVTELLESNGYKVRGDGDEIGVKIRKSQHNQQRQ